MIQRTLLLVCLAATLTQAQSFNYADFSSVSGLTFTGAAAQQGLRARLNPSSANAVGACYYDQMVSVGQGFDTTFSFRMASLVGGGADGFAFVIHNDPRNDMAMGLAGTEMGYSGGPGVGIINALVIEVDTWLSNFLGSSDLSANEISVHTNGGLECNADELMSIGRVSPVTNMSDGVLHTLRIVYVPGTLNIFLDGATTPELSLAFDFNAGGTYVINNTPAAPPMLSGGDFAWVGFTAATGAAAETHDIGSWSFTSTPTNPAFAGTVGLSQGGPFSVVEANGSTGGAAYTVTVPTATTFSIGVQQPPTSSLPCNFYLTAMLGFPGVGQAGTVMGLGNTLYPMPYLVSQAPLYYVLADSFQISLSSIYATPTPWTYSVSGGFPMPYAFTMQGIIEESPGVFAITNGLRVQIF